MPYNDNQVPKRTGLLELLRQSIGSQFVIPVYQRNYTWTTGREVLRYETKRSTRHDVGLRGLRERQNLGAEKGDRDIKERQKANHSKRRAEDRKLTQSLRNAPRREEDTAKAQGTASGVPKAVQTLLLKEIS